MLTKSELHTQQQERLEQLIRELRAVEDDKAQATKAFNQEIKRLNDDIDSLLDEIRDGQAPLFDKNGKPTIPLAPEKGDEPRNEQ